MVPSPKPATSCFPLVLQLILLTWFFNALTARSFKLAISRFPLLVTTAHSSAFSAVGFGSNVRSASPFVASSNAVCVFP